ncbi:NlpC/P60 family protein [Streptomyces hygroscopicus]|uniref:C40 family peptidase n=1 Tax=Streptomyces hygroscopicus TaxID=1912 RepID=UPI00362FA665
MAKKILIGSGAALAAVFALAGGVSLQTTTTSNVANANPNTGAISGGLKPGSVPAQYEPWITKAASACPGLPAPVLAAQLHQESRFTPNAQSPAGARGIAQFMPGTWATWSVDADGDGVASALDPPDAITAQGRLMCSLLKKAKKSGYPDQPIRLALAGYNAGWERVRQFQGIPPKSWAKGETYNYVRLIMAAARKYTAPSVGPSGNVALPAGYTPPSGAPPEIRTAIAWALTQRGGWYHFGGSCTDAHGADPTRWCDCSSLMQQAYKAAGITISRTTFTQVTEGQAVNIDAPQPGDLVFTPGSDGTAARPGHVGMYIGDNRIVEAPKTGVRTRIVTYDSWRNARSEITRIVAVRRIVPW